MLTAKRVFRRFEFLRWGEVWEVDYSGIPYRSLWAWREDPRPFHPFVLRRISAWQGPGGGTLDNSGPPDRAVTDARSKAEAETKCAKHQRKLWGKRS